jgi:hypothetical protein
LAGAIVLGVIEGFDAGQLVELVTGAVSFAMDLVSTLF